MSGMESRPGRSNLVEPRGQGALPSGMAMQPWWTGSGLGAVSPAVVALGSGAEISLSSSPVGGGGGAQSKTGDDARGESSEDSRRSMEPKESGGGAKNHGWRREQGISRVGEEGARGALSGDWSGGETIGGMGMWLEGFTAEEGEMAVGAMAPAHGMA